MPINKQATNGTIFRWAKFPGLLTVWLGWVGDPRPAAETGLTYAAPASVPVRQRLTCADWRVGSGGRPLALLVQRKKHTERDCINEAAGALAAGGGTGRDVADRQVAALTGPPAACGTGSPAGRGGQTSGLFTRCGPGREGDITEADERSRMQSDGR